MKKKSEIKTMLLDHSRAKVELYKTYLSVFLNIISRSYFKKIYLYDLMCGEGIYTDGGKGSPIATVEAIKNHFYSNKENCPDIEILFNDSKESEIEKGKLKIDRVKDSCENIFRPSNVQINYEHQDYKEILKTVNDKIQQLKNEIALLFIDLYGYKDVKPVHIKEIMQRKNTELILFLPVFPMYRFANKSLQDISFRGGDALREFLFELHSTEFPMFTSIIHFIEFLKESFKNLMLPKEVFVDTFTIQRDEQNVYCLFFFTSHHTGFKKMLESKWKLDAEHGKGFKIESTLSLFSESEVSNYPEKLFSYLKKNPDVTNRDLYFFGLQNGFLPKHTTQILKDMQIKNNVVTVALDSLPIKRGSFYIDDETRSIKIQLK